jgi:hypothetical protein
MINYVLLAIFIALQVGDFYTTYAILKKGTGREANPILAWVFDKIGYVAGLAVFKGLAIVIGIFIVQYWNSFYFFVPCIALYSWVVWNNYKVLKTTA